MFTVSTQEQDLTHAPGVKTAPSTTLEAGGVAWGTGEEGENQGSPKAMASFAVTLQPSLVKLDAEVKAGGVAIAGADDVNVLGPEAAVLTAVQNFKEEVAARCGLELRVDKSRLFKWEGGLPPNCPEGLPLAGEQVGDQFYRGFVC